MNMNNCRFVCPLYFIKCINQCGCVFLEENDDQIYFLQHFYSVLILIFVFYFIWKLISDKIQFNNIYLFNESYLPLKQEDEKNEYEFNEEFKEGLI